MKLEIKDYQSTDSILMLLGLIVFIVDISLIKNVDINLYTILILLFSFFLFGYGFNKKRKNEELDQKMKKEKHEIELKLIKEELEEKSRINAFRKERNIL